MRFKWMGCRLERANCVGRECGRFSLFLFFSPLLVFQSPWAYSHGHFVCTLEPTGGFIYARPKTKPVLACSYRVPPFPGATTKKNDAQPRALCPALPRACVFAMLGIQGGVFARSMHERGVLSKCPRLSRQAPIKRGRCVQK